MGPTASQELQDARLFSSSARTDGKNTTNVLLCQRSAAQERAGGPATQEGAGLGSLAPTAGLPAAPVLPAGLPDSAGVLFAGVRGAERQLMCTHIHQTRNTCWRSKTGFWLARGDLGSSRCPCSRWERKGGYRGPVSTKLCKKKRLHSHTQHTCPREQV